MTNPNTLMALAYIQICDNPFRIFCNYICYCMCKSGKRSYLPDELLHIVFQEFGLQMKHHMLRTCISILKRENQIYFLPKGQGYGLAQPQLDIDKFDQDRLSLKSEEEHLLAALVKYVSSFDQSWSTDEARNYLGYSLRHISGVNLFVDGNIHDDSAESISSGQLSPSWYIGKFIQHLAHEKTIDYDYLLKINQGIMIFIGANETSSSNQEISQKFRGTDFYFDTRLVLRALGYSDAFDVKATSELISLIRDEYFGNICIFDHTLTEVTDALHTAAYSLKTGVPIVDDELSYFAFINDYENLDFEVAEQSAKTKIDEDLKFRVQPQVEWNEEKVRKYNLNWQSLSAQIEKNHPMWRERTIQYDVNSINYINILRAEDYSVHFGGKNKLPIFVTSNTALINCIREYTKSHNELAGSSNQTPWNTWTLPIVSDNFLMCRLWLTSADRHTGLPILTLARNAFAAQQSDKAFYVRLCQIEKSIAQKHCNNYVDLDYFRKRKLEEIIARNTQGDVAKISDEIVASSFEELVRLETLSDKKEIEKLEVEGQEKDRQLYEMADGIVQSASLRFINKTGTTVNIVLFIAKSFWVIMALVISVLGYIVNKIIGVNQAYTLLVLPLSALIAVLDKWLNKKRIFDYINVKVLKWAKEKYVEKVKKALTGKEMLHVDKIVESCIKQTKQFKETDQARKLSA